MDELILPRAWQDWHISAEIGEGAYGRVYKAEKENGGVRAVSAIKVIRVPSEKSELLSLRREFQSEEELRRNLKEMVDGYVNEIRAMYRLQGQTHIVSIQDHLVEETDDGLGWRIYIRMEYLRPFDDYAMTHSFSREEIIRLGISLCEALGVCAGYGILHRDVKPENLFVTENGQFKLGDFGIAKALDKTVRSYSAKGTFSYMAPEVFSGKSYDSRADLYSTGIILYKLVNRNRDPFIDPEKQIITHQDREEAMSLRMQGTKLPAPSDADEKLSRVILKACEYEPKNRYDTPETMMQALKELLQQEKTTAGKSPKKWIWLICAAVVLLIAGIAVVLNRPVPSAGVPDSGNGQVSASQAPGNEQVSASQDPGNGYTPAMPVPGETEYGGIRFTLPEGYEEDKIRSKENMPVWSKGKLVIGFQTQEKEPVNTDAETSPAQETTETVPAPAIMIDGITVYFDPENITLNNSKNTTKNDGIGYMFAFYDNPLPGMENTIVSIIFMGPEEELRNNREEFAGMLQGARAVRETSVLQEP